MSILSSTDLTFTGSREEADGVTVFSFRPDRGLPHTAGQHGLLKVPGGGTKAFSLASAPEEPEALIGTHLQSGSKYKTALAALRPGDRASVRGPIMNFTLAKAAPQVVFLAQGVGITPFRSLLVHIAATQPDRDTTLVHVGQDHAFRAETERLARTAAYPAGRETSRLRSNRRSPSTPVPPSTCPERASSSGTPPPSLPNSACPASTSRRTGSSATETRPSQHHAAASPADYLRSDMTLYRLDASIRTTGSHSRAIADIAEREWQASHPAEAVIRRDIAAQPVPATAWAAAMTASRTLPSQRSPAQHEAAEQYAAAHGRQPGTGRAA